MSRPDPGVAQGVLTNLVENAAKHGSALGLCIEGSEVADPGGGGGRGVAVTVRDTGQRIPADDLPRVFDRWFQRAQGRPTGTGLGLWISRGLVEAHGGTLTVESRPGHGAAFTFTLPIPVPATTS